MDYKRLGERIREERLRLNLTQAQLAEAVDISDTYMGAIERGERSLTLDTLVRLVNRLGVTVDYLLSDSVSDSDANIMEQFKQIIGNDMGTALPVFEVSTDPNLTLDLEKLMTWAANQLDDTDLKEAFIASQMISLKAKREAATARIGFYALTAAGIGASPIPVSDAALLTPLQITMSTNIIHIYGMENIASISKALIGNIVISNLGKAFAGGLLKLIPGVGTLIGGAINAGVASLITSALGFAISEICYDSCKKIARGEYVDMTSMFDAETIQEYVQKYMREHKKSDT